jgi:hypothetical protein
MDIEKDLEELMKAFEVAEQNGISPILALELMDRANVLKDAEEYQRSIDDLYERVLAESYQGDPSLMARSLIGYICGLSVQGAIARLPKQPAQKMGRPATAWGPNGEAKLSIYAAVEHQFKSMQAEGLRKSVVDALWRFTQYDKTKFGNDKKIKALATIYSDAKWMIKQHRANKAKTAK